MVDKEITHLSIQGRDNYACGTENVPGTLSALARSFVRLTLDDRCTDCVGVLVRPDVAQAAYAKPVFPPYLLEFRALAN